MLDAPTRPINRKPLYALYLAELISVSGTVMAMIAIPWFVLQSTGSAAQTGITAFFTALPTVIAAFFGGVLVDRLGYKRTSILADLSSGFAILLIPLLYNNSALAFWQLQVLVFSANLLDVPGATARSALMPELAELAGMKLEQATAYSEAIVRSTRLIGAPLAGVLIAFMGASNVLWIDAASFLISALLIGVAVPVLVSRSRTPQHYLTELKEGLQFIQRDTLIQAIIITVMVTNFLDAALSSVVMPFYAKEIFGSTVPLGILIGTLGGAALVGSVLMGIYGYRLPRHAAFSYGYIIVSFRFFMLALFPPLGILIITNIIVGLAVSPINPILGTVQFERIPPDMRARVFGVISAGVMVATPIAVLVAGYLLEGLTLRGTLLILGFGYLAITLSTLVNPAMRQMNRQPAASPAPTLESS
jgi:MFS family permease